jgi:hypothetical protein
MRTVATLIDQYGTSRIAEAMGLPISTIHQWKRDGAIPDGRGVFAGRRVEAFLAVLRRLDDEDAAALEKRRLLAAKVGAGNGGARKGK